MQLSKSPRLRWRFAAAATVTTLLLAGCGSNTDLATQTPQAAAPAAADPAAAPVADPAAAPAAADPGAVAPATGSTKGDAAPAADTKTDPKASTSTKSTTKSTSTKKSDKPAAGTSTTSTKSSTTKSSSDSIPLPVCASPGPAVTIGQVGTFSGLVGANFAGATKTAYVWVNFMNAHGGLGCHPIHFVQIDDQSNPALSQAGVERLVEKEGAVAIFAAFVPLDISGFQAGLNKEKIAAVGGDQAAPEWLTNPYMYPVGGTSRAAIAGSVKQAAGIGKKKIAVLYCVEASPCGSNFNDTIIKDGFAKKFGMDVVYSGAVSITQPDYTAQCENAKNAGADTIAWGLDRAGLQRAAKSCAKLNYFPTLPLIALQGSFDPTDVNIRKSGAFLSSPTFPYLLDTTPALAQFHTAMKQYAPGGAIDTSASLVWSGGMMLARIVDSMGAAAQTKPLTKEAVLAATGNISNETLGGLIPATSYKATGPQKENPCYFGIAFQPDGTFKAPNGMKPSCIY
jgi:ABC-type branched-subunit amino acid transport system substrate-binding protein